MIFDLLKKSQLVLNFRNGGPTCSIFCMCWILLDQLKHEHSIDIFQRVRMLQRQRPAMINSFVCYKLFKKASKVFRFFI